MSELITSKLNVGGQYIVEADRILKNVSVTSQVIANDAVTTAKLADNVVTTAKLADNVVTTAKLADNVVTTAKLAAGVTVPAGTVLYLAQNTAPIGYLKANGAAVSRATYAALFAAIGTTFGTGNGSTTFNLPDLRGEFLRGWDDGRGVDEDTGRAFGSAQLDQMQTITGQFNVTTRSNFADGAFSQAAIGGDDHNGGTGQFHRRVTFNSSNSAGARAGDETRPRNVALLACIKY